MSPSRTAAKQRLLQLDILRGLAILLVLGRHSPFVSSQAGICRFVAGEWKRFGWTGVDLFFVLSGFLIGGLLFKELRSRSQLDVRRFIIRRGLKIWPSYYLSVLVGSILILRETGYDFGRSFHFLLPNYLHIQNYFFRPNTPSWEVLGPTWSLAIEEHFYLALPLLLLFLTRRREDRLTSIPAIPYIAVGLMLFCTGLRCLLLWHGHYPLTVFFLLTHMRIDGLFFGVFLAYLTYFTPEMLEPIVKRRGRLLLCGLALLFPMMLLRYESKFVAGPGFTMLYVGYACILLAIVHTPVGSPGLGRLIDSTPARLIAGIGYYSYTIYLWHVMLAVMPTTHLILQGVHIGPPAVNWLIGTAFYLTLCIAGGVIAGRLVDKPVLIMRERLFPAQTEIPSPAARPEAVA